MKEKNITLVPVSTERMSAKKFLATSKHSDNIASVCFVPPRIGSSGFGQFEVTYKSAMLRHVRSASV
jgi:hypothetical protein